MEFLKYDLGWLDAGDEVTVTLSGDSANVRLLDSSNFSAYERGKQHRYVGGHVTQSPHHMTVPRGGHWYVALDRGGHKYRGRVGVHVQKKNDRILPLAQSQPSSTSRAASSVPATSDPRSRIADIGRNLADTHAADAAIAHDVFISHASEDKQSVARPLHDELVARGLTVWLDEVQLKVGSSLRRRIDQAVANSRFAVVVFSPTFFSKNWTQYELDGLVAREMTGEQIILPIWHSITKDELMKIAPSLTDKVALSTAVRTVAEIADEIAAAIGSLDER